MLPFDACAPVCSQNFNVDERLVKPWNQLQQAKVHVAEFLSDAAGGTSIDLEAGLDAALITFETVLTDEVLQQFGKMFDLGNYSDAEGDPLRGLSRISVLVGTLGGELGRVAKQAYDTERTRQKDVLDKIHLRGFDLLKIEVLLEQDGFEKQSHAIEQYLEKSHEQASAMNAVPATCELVVEYRLAAKLIEKEVHSLVVSEFAPLFKDDFLQLSAEHINYLDGLCAHPARSLASSPLLSTLLTPDSACAQAGSYDQRALQRFAPTHAASAQRWSWRKCD